jgi:hypothetical protein
MGKRSLKKWKDRKPQDNDNEISPAQVEKIQPVFSVKQLVLLCGTSSFVASVACCFVAPVA